MLHAAAPAELRMAVFLVRERIEADIRRMILGEIGVAPRVVRLVPSKWMVKSSAGKPARSTNRTKFLRENPELAPASPADEDRHG